MFNNEIELGKFLGSTDVIQDAYQTILEMTFPFELRTSRSGNIILAFKCSPEYTTRFLKGGFDLIPSDKLQIIDFISTKVNSSFSINEAAVEMFQHLSDDIKELENKYINTSLIITGSGLGGYLAILSTLRMHHAIDVKISEGYRIINRPICITFGSPSIGNKVLQYAVTERPQWKCSFLNVVAKKDPVASFLSSDTRYKPFGTFLFCTESGGHTAIEDHYSILAVLDGMKLWNAGELQHYDYTHILSFIRRKILYRGNSELNEFTSNSLRVGVTLQLKEVGLLNHMTKDDIGKMEKIRINIIKSKTHVQNDYGSIKELNDMKISLTDMEWYMKGQKLKGGYYDSYKNAKSREEISNKQIVSLRQRYLNKYWKKIVEEKNQMPQKEGTKLRMRWLLGGTNYRRIVEPLDIAEYYKNGNTNYIKYRSEHYKLLEKWLDEDKKHSTSMYEVKRNKPASLTEDSCFWAHVEEALILLGDLVVEGSIEIKHKLEEFEAYVMREINNYSVSPDIFLQGSSFIKWWNEYKSYKGNAYVSEFAQYMNYERYRSYK